MSMRRVLGAILLYAFLAGPTPGAVGDCGGDDRNGPADEMAFCVEFLDWVFVRTTLRGEAPAFVRDDCRRMVQQICVNSRLNQCLPTVRSADACIAALSVEETIETPFYDLAECQREQLCTVEGDGNEVEEPTIEDLCPAAVGQLQ